MLLEGKTGLVLNVVNKNSIGWACAEAAARHGAKVGVGAQNDTNQRVNDHAPSENPTSVRIVNPPPFNRELLMEVLAETAVDRVCARHAPVGPGLSKFRLMSSDPGSRGDSHSRTPQRDEQPPDSAEASEFRASRKEAKLEETNSPRVARYHESTRRPHLLLRLLSRF